LFKLQQVQNTGTDYRLTNANDPCINEEQLHLNIVRDYPFFLVIWLNRNNGIVYFTIVASCFVGPVTAVKYA
jgi:protein associated with RNAse G/E